MTDPRWPARLSVAASLMLAVALFWPDPRSPVMQAMKTPTQPMETSMPTARPKSIALPLPPRSESRPIPRPSVIPLTPAQGAEPSALVDSLQPSAKEETKPVVALVPTKRPASPPKMLPQTSPPAAPPATAPSLAQGRALLRILEHGTGPEIDFAWPERPGPRNALFALLRRCYGMQVVLLDGANRLYRLADPAGRPWAPNIDRISGFSRRIGGLTAAGEKDLVSRLRRRHKGINNARPIRLFPRAFDGALLGGLAQLIGKGAADLRSLSARYRMRGERLWMIDVRVNGKSVPGRVDLSPVAACATSRRRV